MKAKKPLLSPLVGISQTRTHTLATIEEEDSACPCLSTPATQTPAPTTTPKAVEVERSTPYSASFTSVRINNMKTNDIHSKSGFTKDVNSMNLIPAEKIQDGSDESVIVHIYDSNVHLNNQGVNIGWTVPAMLSGNTNSYSMEEHSEKCTEKFQISPVDHAVAIQEINKAVILGPLLHRQPLRSATLARQCVQGNIADKMRRLRKLSTGANAIHVAYTSDTSDDIP